MRLILSACLLVLGSAWQTSAQEIVSAYTDIDTDKHCSMFAGGDEEEGDWANFVCPGYRGYPVIINYGDLRESILYGFPPEGDAASVWESFAGFNSTGPRIEWRIEKDGEKETPFATIHRWFVSDGGNSERTIEVLVVEKVGQIEGRESCAVGYVIATGNPNANEKARIIADRDARGFSCGDEPAVEVGTTPLPPIVRWEN